MRWRQDGAAPEGPAGPRERLRRSPLPGRREGGVCPLGRTGNRGLVGEGSGGQAAALWPGGLAGAT
eukprot:15430188-Alexandrium_andersonii.AAC.1